jgi:2-methylcitrate dehydratase PrpD
MEDVAFKPYACGTMAQPFIDCALALRRAGIDPDSIASIHCKVGEGTVHRLWEPLADKRRPASSYGAKFSVPFCIAVGILDGAAGLAQFTEARLSDPQVLDLAARIGYRIDPANEYPANYTGHLEVRLVDGVKHAFHQAHLRGGKNEPLSDSELLAKYQANSRHAGWDEAQTARAQALLSNLFADDDLAQLAQLRA